MGAVVQTGLVTYSPCVVDSLGAVKTNAYTVGRLHSFAACQFLADDTAVSVHEPDFILVYFIVPPLRQICCIRQIVVAECVLSMPFDKLRSNRQAYLPWWGCLLWAVANTLQMWYLCSGSARQKLHRAHWG